MNKIGGGKINPLKMQIIFGKKKKRLDSMNEFRRFLIDLLDRRQLRKVENDLENG